MEQGIFEIILSFLSKHINFNPASSEVVFSSDFWSVVHVWFIIFALLLAVILAIFASSRSMKLFDLLAKHLPIFSILVWFVGVCVYIVGFYDAGVNGLSVVPRAIISSFKMFVVSNDLARVYSVLRHHTLYMTIFSLVHFCAAFISFLFIFKLIGHRVKTSCRLAVCRLTGASKGKNIHLFWGINEESCLLAESIDGHSNNVKDILVLVDVDEDTDDNLKKKASLSSIANTITIKNSEISRLDKIGAYVFHCYGGPSAVKINGNDDIFARLNLRAVRSIISKSSKLNCYFLSSDENSNITGALNLQHDNTMREILASKLSDPANKPKIYVHACRTANNELFNNYSQYSEDNSKIEIKIIDSAYLSVLKLKKDKSAMPVKCVDLDESSGTVKGGFTSLVAGFGKTGQEAFRFLYEFSAFVDKQHNKIPFKCYAFDEKMDKIEGVFRSRIPDIGEDELCMLKAHAGSKGFWESVSLIINDLNYAVITINNDNAGLELAVDLFKYAMQFRDSKKPMLKIMLRCYENQNYIRMKDVVDNLNRSIAGGNVQLGLFGMQRELYNYNTILSDTVLREAKEFHKAYKKSKLSADEQWMIDFSNEKISSTAKDNNIHRYYAICDLNRRIEQNISNSMHLETKMFLLGLSTEEFASKLNLYYGYQKSRKVDTINYTCPSQDLEILHNLAMVEHERWIASHKLLGYKYDEERNLVSKYHECMMPWSKLGDVKKSYDCDSVDTSIRMVYDRLSKKNCSI